MSPWDKSFAWRESTVWLWQFHREVPSTLTEASRVLSEIVAELQRQGWSERDIFSVQLAVEEALVNAIKHGNRSDQSKLVSTRCRVSRQAICVEIADEGEGFDPSQVPDPTSPERLEEPSGRGIMLMRTFMNRVTYNAKGNVVTLEKTRSDAEVSETA